MKRDITGMLLVMIVLLMVVMVVFQLISVRVLYDVSEDLGIDEGLIADVDLAPESLLSCYKMCREINPEDIEACDEMNDTEGYYDCLRK